jgi:hypothetical protein
LELDCALQLLNFGWDAVTMRKWRWELACLVETTTQNLLDLFDD